MKLPEVPGAVEIVPGRLFWARVPKTPQSTDALHCFSIDSELVYEPFHEDFGPLNLAMVSAYCHKVSGLLSDPALAGARVVHCCTGFEKKQANAAFLACAYMVVVEQRTAEEAYRPFASVGLNFMPFRDALTGRCTFGLTILDCLEGLEKGIELGWFDWRTFDAQAYESMGEVSNGDANWIIPGKFLAFAGPSATGGWVGGLRVCAPEDLAPTFHDANIKLVVRLNNSLYDRYRFVECGIEHAELYFADGSCPTREIYSRFLQIAEREPGPIAVHCKAGLGRTCTLIGLYAMKHYRFPARAFIGWSRICRPGSVLGIQQQFLVDMQGEMFDEQVVAAGATRGAEQHVDVGQGERLVAAKQGRPNLAPSLSWCDAKRSLLCDKFNADLLQVEEKLQRAIATKSKLFEHMQLASCGAPVVQ